MSGELTERETGGGGDGEVADFHAESRQTGEAVNIESGLAVLCLGQLRFWTAKCQSAERAIEDRIRAFKEVGDFGIAETKIFSHADSLGPLAREEDGDALIFHR